MKYSDVLLASNLFKSKSDCLRMIKQGAVKLNKITVDDFNEELELGDFLNFIWFPGAAQLIQKHGGKPNFIVVSKGKSHCLLRVVNNSIEKLT